MSAPMAPGDGVDPVPGANAEPARAAAAYLRPGLLQLASLPPLSLYVHVPWCLRKCPYCDFNSHAATQEVPEDAYVAALCADLESALPLVWGRPVSSVFIGGGTPSLLSGAAVDRFLSAVRARLPLAADCEITLEANPGTFERDRFQAFRDAGVNRLSLGVQSFDDESLRRLGRVHDAGQARAAVEAAARLFGQFNIDLMYGLPGQDAAGAAADLEAALGYAPPHLSLYELTLEPNTLFARFPPTLPDESEMERIEEALARRVADAGLRRYEISAYAREGMRCRHNLNYWQFGDYLGIGAGAHGKLSFPHRIVRQVRPRHPDAYLRAAATAAFVAEERELRRGELPFEFMLNALRLVDGFDPSLFPQRTGLPPTAIAAAVHRLEARGLLAVTTDRIRPTEAGRRFLNDVQAEFLDGKTAP